MSQTDAPSGKRLVNVRLHRPGAIAVYMVFGGGVGLFLYGQNVSRRGRPTTGRMICALAAVAVLATVILGAAGEQVAGMGLIGALLAIGIYKSEDDAYEKSVVQGARPTSWWPPALVLVAMIIALLVVQRLLFPEVWEESS